MPEIESQSLHQNGTLAQRQIGRDKQPTSSKDSFAINVSAVACPGGIVSPKHMNFHVELFEHRWAARFFSSRQGQARSHKSKARLHKLHLTGDTDVLKESPGP
jgi:hypothetical protein